MLAEIDIDTAESIGLQYVQESYLGLLDVIFVYEKGFHKEEAEKEKEADLVKGFQLVLEYMMPPSEFKSFVEAGRWTTAIQDLSDEELDALEPKIHEKVWRTEKNRRASLQAKSWATSGNKYMNEEKVSNGN
jgi:hypothetical protein